MLEHVPHPAIAAREVESEEGAHEGPPESGAEHDRRINLFRGRDAVGDEMKRFTPQGFLQPVRNVPGDLMLDVQGSHPQPPVEGTRLLDGAGFGALTRDDLDQGQQVDRIEGMADQHALGMPAARLDPAGQQAR